MNKLSKLHRLKPCANCPMTKGCTKHWLGKERMQKILQAESFVCHETTSETARRKQCAGHMLLLKGNNIFYRLAMGSKHKFELQGEETVFDSIEDCIDHHRFK